jgi:hypothetical protein
VPLVCKEKRERVESVCVCEREREREREYGVQGESIAVDTSTRSHLLVVVGFPCFAGSPA